MHASSLSDRPSARAIERRKSLIAAKTVRALQDLRALKVCAFFRYLASNDQFEVDFKLLNFARKIGGWLLAALLFGLPLLNCVMPAEAMTAAEKECCKKMAGDCGRAGMSQSHSCCPPSGSIDVHPILKAAPSPSVHFPLVAVDVLPQIELVTCATASLPSWIVQVHGPPGETPPDTIVLRI